MTVRLHNLDPVAAYEDAINETSTPLAPDYPTREELATFNRDFD